MSSTTCALLVCFVSLILATVLYGLLKKAEGVPLITTKEIAHSSLTELKTWGTYLITLQLAAIGGMGYLLDKTPSPNTDTKGITIADISKLNPTVTELRITFIPQAPSQNTAPIPDDTQQIVPHVFVGGLAMLFFAASITVATFLLGAIPSLIMRISETPSDSNDLFHKTLFSHSSRPYVGPLTGLQYVYFLFGALAFVIFMYIRVSGKL